jgi:hypothetical protein
MKYRKQTATGDMTFGNGLLDFYIDSPEAVGQSVETRLRLWAGEWFLDITEGTQYQTNVLGTGKSQSAGPIIRQRILETEGVTDIMSFDLNIDADNRKLTVLSTIDTIYGQTKIEVIT